MGSFHRNEEDDDALTKMESGSLLQEFNEEKARSTVVIAQAEAEQFQEFCPSSVKHGMLQPQTMAPFHRGHSKTVREAASRQAEFRQPLWRSSSRKKSLKKEGKRRAPFEKPSSSVVSPSIRRFEVRCCSDIYTSGGRSPELSSQPESVYIYAESINGYDTLCSGAVQDWSTLCLYAGNEKTCDVVQDPRFETGGTSIEALFGSDSSCESESIRGDCDSDSSCVNADWEWSFDSEDDSCNLVYSLAEAHWGSASSCSGSAASGYITDYDLGSLSSSIMERQFRSTFGGHFKPGHCDLSVGRFDAVHCEPAACQFEGKHCYPAVNNSDKEYHHHVSRFKSGYQNVLAGNFEAGHCDRQVIHFETGQCDLPDRYFEPEQCDSLIGQFEAGHCDSPVSHFEAGYCDSPVSHFVAGHCDSIVGHFEAGYCGLPDSRFEAGHSDSLIGFFEAGHCDSPNGHFDKASCDLYNASSECSTAICHKGKEHHSVFNLEDCSDLTWNKLQGVVTHPDRHYIGPFFHEMMKETEHDRNQEKVKINKGFLFHPQRFLQAKNSEYREGQEYSVLRHVQNGSYGDVFSVRDKQTGFTCAAKRIPLSSFSWEEVGTWSRLDSPRVLQLYGAVREDLNVVLFMDLKTGSLAQFLKARGCFPEDLALYYHRQVLQALEHLHGRKVIHLDVKVDNVLLSKDKRECFLCDFGLSEMLDQTGYSTKTFRGNGLRGTESHMSPEVAHGDPRSDKADIWSSCCMLLHMLSGHQPWTRYYTHPLCLKIVSEPAPLWEIPAGCDPLTCDIISGGLVKEPRERDSARELLEKSGRALRAVGGLSDPVQSATQNQPRPQISPSTSLLNKPSVVPPPVSITTRRSQEALAALPRIQWVSTWRERAAEEDSDSEDTYEDSDGRTDRTERWLEYWGLRKQYRLSEDENSTDEEREPWAEEGRRERAAVEKQNEEEGESDEEIESDLGSLRELGSDDEWEPLQRLQILYGTRRRRDGDEWSETEEEECVPSMTSLNHTTSCQQNSRLTLTCHRSVCTSDTDLTDKGSDWPDDLSSGVFSSYSSLTDERSFNVDWSVSTDQPPSISFKGFGVDIWVEDVSGKTFRIRERLRVKLGHVAIGISSQVSMRAFCLATLDGKLVSPDAEVLESRMWLLCVPAPDNSTNWTWRIQDGKMETQETDGLQSDTCSTLAA